MGLGPSSVEHGCSQHGVDGQCTVVAWAKRTRFAPAAEGFCSLNARAVFTGDFDCISSPPVSDLRNGDSILCIDRVNALAVI